jgi:hypothetical protein
MVNPVISFLLEHNRKQSELFCSSDAALLRRAYRINHPTEIGALKCMDGRINLPVICQVPTGIIQPFRNIAGEFDLGWPFFGHILNEWIEYGMSRGRRCLVFVTYHWSAGNEHRGCKGFNYDKPRSMEFMDGLKRQIERVYGNGHSVVYPIKVGIETDADALVLHGTKPGDTLDLAQVPDITDEELRLRIEQLYPDMQIQMIMDLLPLLRGNLRHIAKQKASHRPVVETEHCEQVVAVGRGFDWLHLHNKALIIGPYSYDLGKPVATAARIVLDNLQAGRIPAEDGVVLMTSASYRDEAGPARKMAEEKARSLANFSYDTIIAAVPEIKPYLHQLVGTVNEHTKLFTPVK